MDSWRPYDDPMAALWNVARSSSFGRDIWYAVYGGDPARLWYAVERQCDGRVIGSLSLREIMVPESARLGIGFGSEYVDQGYGTEALVCFLPHVFEAIGLRRLLLDVAAPNLRAIHVYEKLGFQYTGRDYRVIPSHHDLTFLDDPSYRDMRSFFTRRFGQVRLLFLHMALERAKWRAMSAERDP